MGERVEAGLHAGSGLPQALDHRPVVAARHEGGRGIAEHPAESFESRRTERLDGSLDVELHQAGFGCADAPDRVDDLVEEQRPVGKDMAILRALAQAFDLRAGRLRGRAETGRLPVEQKIVQAEGMAVRREDEIDLAGGAGAKRLFEVPAQEGGIRSPAAQLMPLETRQPGPHALVSRPASGIRRCVPASKTRPFSIANGTISPIRKRAVPPGSMERTGPRGVAR